MLARRTLTLRETLALATRICAQLERASAAGVLKSDLRPETIGWNEVTGEVRLLTLRGPIGDWRAAEREALGQQDGLAYISPEMTGRMNREVDHRSALYSLGIILYELLTGELPFDAEDAMGMIHCHIARAPVAPDRRNPAIPPVLSRIVLHLMAKDAEDRYQSAAGLAADLETCLRWLDDGEPIADFEIAASDRKVQLRIPRRLYGREREVELLARSFERAGAIRSELCLVRGPSGVGKSALVGELRQAALERGGFFVEGKFDQLKCDIPYSALRQALRGLIRGLLTRSDDELLDWRRRLLVALENSGQLMVDLVPDLAPVIGEQPAVEKLLPAEAQVQFHAVFERFIGVFAQVEHPLVLFLDDLQWADSSTLGLFQVLLGSPDRRGLLLVGSYRDDEVGADHPLQLALEELARSAPVHDLVVGPLPVDSIAQLVRDTLQPGAAANELAVLVHERTGGNPLFAAQLLEALHQAQLLSWSVERGWHWDLRAIAAAATESVLDLMVARLRRLPPATQAATRLGACMGNLFHCEQLAAVMEQPESQVALDLDPALASGLLVAGEEDGGEIRFRHDRVQQGAYSLIPEAEREGFHLTIGRLLLAGKESCPRGERLFDVVSHLNRARRLITSPEERRELVELNLAAAERARASVAFRSFLELMKVAAECMPEDAWSSDPDLADRVQLDLAEAHYLNGQREEL
ncbi:MAG TPA: AAA family ATPase, partial [Kofleriaceae bacterium]|nr:AAA family ATPase [Kofleriaceae bacterium]